MIAVAALINGIMAGLLPHNNPGEHTVDFIEHGDKLVHQIDSEHQNYKFIISNQPIPAETGQVVGGNIGFREYGLPVVNSPQRGSEERPLEITPPHGGEEILSPEIPIIHQNKPSESLSLPLLPYGNDVQAPIIVPSVTPTGSDILSAPIVPEIQTITHEQGPNSGPIIVPENSVVNVIDKDNQYTHGFSLTDGTKVSEHGHLITTNGGWEYVLAKQGSYEYISPEGNPIKVNWIADDKGFRHL